jgi:DMSO/TMAO reductase YedYZ molybdopterin-dependent catalytic subunit
MPTTTWLNDAVPVIDPERHEVAVRTPGGERIWRIGELADVGDGLRATLDCTSGWYATQDWRGCRLDRLVAGTPGLSVLVRSITGYARRFPLADAPGILLATHAGDAPLDPGHGAPVRLVAPGRRGFWWVKWVASIEVDDVPWWWQPPFPLT